MKFSLLPINNNLSTRRASRAGFTLVELLIYITITAFIMGMFSAILITITKVQSRETSASKSLNEIGFLMAEMRRLTRSATDLNVVSSQKLELIMIATTTPATKQTLVYDSVAKNILIVSSGPGGTSTSTLSSSQLSVDDLAFRNLSSGASKSVNILMTATVFPNNATLILTKTIQTTAALYVQEP